MLRRARGGDVIRLHRGALLLVVGGLYVELAGLVAGALTGWSAVPLALVVLGLVLVAAGALTGLRAVRVRAVPTLATATVAIVAVLTVLLAGGRGPLPGGGHPHGALESSAVLAEIDALARSAGTRAALDRLDTLTAGARGTERHGLAHELGRRSLGHAGGDVAAAFGGCDQRFDGACYHGVLQAFVAAELARVDAGLPTLCEQVVLPPGASALLRYECDHGLGHGLAAASGTDQALAECDRLVDGREDCYGGVFMERVQAGAPARCAELGEAYQSQCYLHQPAASLAGNGGNVEATLAECDGVPAAHVAVCHLGVGRDVGSLAAGDVERAHELCGLAGPAARSWCRAGTVSLLVSGSGEAGAALEYCALAPAAGQPACFAQVGEMLALLHADTQARAGGCAAAVPAGVAPCRRGAGLPP